MPDRNFPVPAWPVQAIRHLLPDRGIWLAGGAVRDLLLQRVPHDWDFVLEGSGTVLARQVANTLAGNYYTLDEARGTGRALVSDPVSRREVTLDFATLRASTLEDDLRARDFTINAMALTPDGCLIDPTYGRADLSAGLVCATGPTAFQDDPIRLVRAIRLAVQLGFTLDPETARAARAAAGGLPSAAPERIRAELVNLLSLPAAARGIGMLTELGLAEHIFPEITGSLTTSAVSVLAELDQAITVYHGTDRFHPAAAHHWATAIVADPETGAALQAYLDARVGADTSRALLIKWVGLFCDPPSEPREGAGTAGPVTDRMEALRFSRREISFVHQVLTGQEAFGAYMPRIGAENRQPDRRSTYRYFQATGEGGVAAVILYLARLAADSEAARGPAWLASLRAGDALLTAYLRHRGEAVAPSPLLSGSDIMEMGVPQGPGVGEALALLREAQAAGEVTSVKEARDLIARHCPPAAP